MHYAAIEFVTHVGLAIGSLVALLAKTLHRQQSLGPCVSVMVATQRAFAQSARMRMETFTWTFAAFIARRMQTLLRLVLAPSREVARAL